MKGTIQKLTENSNKIVTLVVKWDCGIKHNLNEEFTVGLVVGRKLTIGEIIDIPYIDEMIKYEKGGDVDGKI